MKKHKIKILFIVTLFFLVMTLPYLIDLKFVGTYIEKTVKNEYDLDINIQKTHWYWLPKPGIFLQETGIRNADFQSDFKIIAIYPELLSLLKGEVVIDEIELITPEIAVKSSEKFFSKFLQPSDEPAAEFPEFKLSISNGILSLPFDGRLAVLKNQIKPFTFLINELEVSATANTIDLSATLEAPFASKLTSETRMSRKSPDTAFADYVWETRNVAKNLNYYQIKKAALLLFGESEEVHDVFDDIHKSEIPDLWLTFKGTASDFSNMDNLIAAAEIENTVMTIPETKMLLTAGNGRLKMKNAVLYGNNLTATLNNSFGTNGHFSLGLAEDDFSFRLTVDIDADLTELQETTDEFIDQPLKQELGRIKNLTGRTRINLKLADDLNDLKTWLYFPDLSGTFYYDLLKRDVTLNEGVLDISPQSVTWQNLNFTLGENTFSDVTGSVNFQKDLYLNLTGGTARVNSADLHKVLSRFPEIDKTIKNNLTDIDGMISLSNLTVSGPPQKVEKWHYNAQFAFEKLRLSSRHLPSPVSLSCKMAVLSDTGFKTDQLVFDYFDSSVSVAASIKHNLFAQQNGSLMLTGTAGKRIQPWLKKKDWIPQSFFPKLPCKLSPVSIQTKDTGLSLTANIIHNDKINTLVDITDNQNTALNGSIDILAGKEKADIQFQLPMKKDKGGIKLSFQGEVKKSSVAKILETCRFPVESLSGEFDLFYPVEKNVPIRMGGTAVIKNARIELDNNGAFLLDSLTLKGKKDVADLTAGSLTIICPDNLKGIVRKNLHLEDLESKLYFQYNDAALLRLLAGKICDVDIKGDLGLPSKKLDFALNLEEKEQITFDDLFRCLGLKDMSITGNVSLNAEIKGTPENLTGSRIGLRAKKGIIKKASLLSKILSLINLTELFKKNSIRTLLSSGYHYDNIEIDAVISGQTLHITRGQINGVGLNLYGTGTIDLETLDIDMIILASPFKTIDSLVNNIPIIGEKITGKNKSLLSVPIKVEGKVGEPKTRILPKTVSNVSSNVMDLFIKTFKLPFKLTRKIISNNPSGEKQPADKN